MNLAFFKVRKFANRVDKFKPWTGPPSSGCNKNSGLHCHVGSHGMDLSQIVQGAKQLVALAEKINRQAGHKQVVVLDIGGGVNSDYHNDEYIVDFSRYKEEVIGKVPELQNFQILTEFGRSAFTKSG